MSSTRVRSEEIYRERVTSDSLFASRTHYPANVNSANANSDNQQQQQQQSGQEQLGTSSALLQDDVFENDDLFGPPPLPSKSDSKRTTKSKVSSLFDDSDSGDEFFSAASSGSRSQKSTDFHVTVSSSERTKSVSKSGGLFDDDVDIFGGKDAPDVDIFGATSKPGSRNAASNGPNSVTPKNNNGEWSIHHFFLISYVNYVSLFSAIYFIKLLRCVNIKIMFNFLKIYFNIREYEGHY